jgi:transposase InsO family protein
MGAESYRLRTVLPARYGLVMKTLSNSFHFEQEDAAKFRLHCLEHMKEYGWKSTVDAFGVGKSTLYDWKKAYEGSGHKLSSLIPLSTRPHRVRRQEIHPHMVEMVKNLREEYGRIGKEKIQVLLEAYGKEIGKKTPGRSAIGKLIKRNRWYFGGRRKWKRKRKLQARRLKTAPRETQPGYVEMDSIILYADGQRHQFMCCLDVVTKCAWACRTTSLQAKHARNTLQTYQAQIPVSLRCIQTDNGSEFLGEFHEYLEEIAVKHNFIYPRCPRINGVVERFNRTLQEEFLDRNQELLYDRDAFTAKLEKYLVWYNTKRPHTALGYQTPMMRLQQLHSEM